MPQCVINVFGNAALRQTGETVIRVVKRYGSRKLYDTEDSRYVSLDDLASWIREGQELQVIDNATGDDVTAQTLAQVILELSRAGKAVPPAELLHEMIRRGGEAVASGVDQLQHGVDRLLQASVERLGPVRRIREETEVLRRRLEELEASLSGLEEKLAHTTATTATTERDRAS